jgi:hypothetical protein
METIGAMYYTTEENGELVASDMGVLTFQSPFADQKMTQKVKTFLSQDFFREVVSHVKDNTIFCQLIDVEDAIKSDVTLDQTEYTYEYTEKINGTMYVGFPFRIVPVVTFNSEYYSVDTSLVECSEQQSVLLRGDVVPLFREVSRVEKEAFEKLASKDSLTQKFTIPESVFNDVQATDSSVFRTDFDRGRLQSMEQYLPSLDIEASLGINSSSSYQEGFVHKDDLPQFLEQNNYKIDDSIPLPNGFLYVTLRCFADKIAMGRKQLLRELDQTEDVEIRDEDGSAITVSVNVDDLDKLAYPMSSCNVLSSGELLVTLEEKEYI